MPYFLQHVEWTGAVDPNTARADHYGREILITTAPGHTNMSGEPRVAGWLGTTNGWYRYGHGEFPSIDAARQAAREQFGALYEGAADDTEGGVVETWYDQERAAAHWQAQDWLHDARHDLMAQLREGKDPKRLAGELDNDALSMTDDTPAGVLLHGTLEYLMALQTESDE